MAVNGQLPASDLGYISGVGARVLLPLVTQTNALRAAFAKRFEKALTITDAYRPYSVQETIFRQRYTTNYSASAKLDRRWWLNQYWWRKAGFASAATPGTSNHGWGRALDFGAGVNALNSNEQKWMVANAPRFGWVWPSWARVHPYLEPWHYEGVAVSLASYITYINDNGINVPGLSLPDPLKKKEEDMYAIRNHNGEIGLISPDGTLEKVPSAGVWASLLRSGVVSGYHQETDGTVWNALTSHTAAVRAREANVDVSTVASQVATLVGPMIQDALTEVDGVDEAAIAASVVDLIGKRLTDPI